MGRSEARVWLGVDLGTQGCRVAAVDHEGQLVASAQAPLASVRPAPGRHEQDPGAWKAAVAAACRQVRAALGNQRIDGLAICGTSGTLVVCNRHGIPLTPAIMYDDTRAVAEAPEVFEAWQPIAARNGYRVQVSWALPKLVWVLRHVEGAAEGGLLHCADFIAGWLASTPVATDSSHALKSGYDLVGRCWPEDAFKRVGVPLSVLPRVVRPGSLLGVVSADGAAESGLPEGTPIYGGMTDGCASQVASGTMHEGQWNSALGTTFVLKGVSHDLLQDDNGAIYSHAHPDGGWLPGGASNSGAGVLAATFPGADPAEMDQVAAAYAPTSVVRYPLTQRGERFPFVREDAEPFQVGTAANDGEAFAALLQGVAFVERLSLDYVQMLGAEVEGAIAFTGRTTRSALWTQMRADVLGRPVRLPLHPDSAVGMAIVAAASGGSVSAACDRMVQTCAVIEPRPVATQRYLQVYGRMVDELERRGYIPPAFAQQARAA